MPAKMARSAPLPPFRVPGIAAVVRAARLSCQNAGKGQNLREIGSHLENAGLSQRSMMKERK